jgi:small neutral amino acid transporter SnatA (MarC family)
MVEVAKNLLLIVCALFPIVDPLGGSPILLALTRDYASDGRRELSRRIAIDSFFLLVGSYLIGTYILAFFGISLPVVQVGRGLDRNLDGMGNTKTEDRRRTQGEAQKRPTAGSVRPGVLPTHDASNGRVGINLGRGYFGRKRTSPRP